MRLEKVPQTSRQNPAMPEFVPIPRKGTVRFESIERGLLYLAIFLAPYSLLRIPGLFFTVSDLLFCLCLICLAIVGRIPASPLRGATPLWLTGFGMLLVGLMLSSIINGDAVRGAIVSVQYAFAYMILLVILIRDDFDLTHRMAAAFLAGLLLVDIHGIITFYAVGYVPSEGKGVVTGGKRLATVLRNPNLAAAMNALTMPFLLYFWSTGRLRTIFALPIFAVFVVTVVLTSSNSGLIVLSLCLMVFTAFIVSMRLLLRLAAGGGLLTLILIASGGTSLLPKAFQTRVLGALSSGDISEAGTFVSRSELIREAIQVINEKGILFVGLGADQFRTISAQSTPVHNLYLLLWVEGGIISLLGWLLFAVAGGQIWLGILRAGGPKQVLATIAATVSVLLGMAMFNAHMYARYWAVPLLLSYGLGLVHLRQIQESNAGFGRPASQK
jgi:O-antigen ligase